MILGRQRASLRTRLKGKDVDMGQIGSVGGLDKESSIWEFRRGNGKGLVAVRQSRYGGVRRRSQPAEWIDRLEMEEASLVVGRSSCHCWSSTSIDSVSSLDQQVVME